MGILDKANRLIAAQNNLKQLFIDAFASKGVNAANKTLKEMPALISQITGEGGSCHVIVSETEPENAPEGTIWIIPIDPENSDSNSSSSDPVVPEDPSDSSSSVIPDEPSEAPSDSSSSSDPVVPEDPSDSSSSAGGDALSLAVDFTDNSGFYGSYTDMLDGDYAYDSSLEAYRNAGNSTAFGVIKWFDTPPSWNNYTDNGGGGAGWYLCSYNPDNTIKDMFYNLHGSANDINSITAGDYTGNYTMFADSSYTFSFTISLSGSNSGGDTSNADYTVTGSSTAEVNGDYTNTGDTVNGYPSYSNGKGYYILYTPNYGGMWQITSDINASGPPKHSVMSSSALPPTSGWSGVTVTEYGGSSGGSSNMLTATCYSCAKVFDYDPAEGTPMCPHCGMPQ